jgi:LuxR family transcriptional regulator
MSLPNLGLIRLSSRQKEVLEAVGDGKPATEIAVLLGISVAMVEKHLRLARESLGVDTTAQALLKAAFLNQVYVRTG